MVTAQRTSRRRASRNKAKIAKDLCKGLEALRDNLYDLPLQGDTPWTMRFKKAILSRGRELGFQVWGTFASHRGRNEEEFDEGEWLFDICWANCRSNDWQELHSLFLACEIEWSRDERETINDFLKLIVADADIKLFVFACRKPEETEGRIKRLRTLARKARPSQGIFVVIGVPDGGPFPRKEARRFCSQFAQGTS